MCYKKAVENQRLLKWLGNLEVNFLDSPFKKTRISAIFFISTFPKHQNLLAGVLTGLKPIFINIIMCFSVCKVFCGKI